MTPCMFGIDKIVIADMVNYATIDFFGHVKIETAIAGFHVINRYFHPPGNYTRDGAVGITENQYGIRAFLFEYRLYSNEDIAIDLAKRGCIDIKKIIGLVNLQLFEKYLAEFIIVVLARVNDFVVNMFIQHVP